MGFQPCFGKTPMSRQEPLTGATHPQEPIPGYRLLERIGRGGYGDVWKTLAPGGVPKAVKLIYGDDSSRMATELRSLNRVKDIRHPFLLSIERIEHCGELLAIVTELGDRNLQQFFQECRGNGLKGIRQDELLNMMRDVADALDFIYAEYALQHLDIKPANLLLFGRRLKVADFGLVKNIYERSASLVHGLTPTYAAPEIFEGHPSRASDQYSLAILYQEMLTGVLPFNGINAARLATQHLRETPDLSPLPPSQQPIVARALSKDPLRRFSSCLELVKELTLATQQSSTVSVPGNISQTETLDSPGKTPNIPAGVGTSTPVIMTGGTATQPRSAGHTSPSGPVASASRDQKKLPTIVIGVGGSAGKVLQNLRLRITDRLSSVEALPAFKMLFLDVDHEALNEINHNHDTWSELETVPTPLRSSAEYREQGHLHRRWLSRRWLYNVPRNLRTDGLRPLGRLALMSNARRIIATIRSAIAKVTAANPGVPPRILIVSSISGGTGSGMVLDLAYAARHELRTAGFPDAPVDGILLHSAPVGAGRDKAVLNATAMLCELDHYSTPGSYYPGEPLLQTPPFHGNNQTFTSTQFLHLGEDLSEVDWLRAVDNVAELVYCRLLTNLDQTIGSPPQATRFPAMDLVQLQQIGGYSGSFVEDLTRQLCVDMIDGWCGAEPSAEFGDRRQTTPAATLVLNAMEESLHGKYHAMTAQAEEKLLSCGVDVEQLLRRAREMLEQELKTSQREFLLAQFGQAVNSVKDDVSDHEVARLAMALQDRAIGLDFGERPTEHPRATLFDLLHARLASQAMPIAARFINWVCDVIDQSSGGVDAARRAAEAGRDCLREIISVLDKEIRERQTQQTASRIQLLSPPTPESVAKNSRGWLSRKANPRASLGEQMVEHGLSSFEELLEVLVQSQLRAIEANVLAVIDHLLNMWHELKQLGKRIGSQNQPVETGRAQPSRYEQSLQKWLLDFRPRLVQELRKRMDHSVLKGTKKLQRFLIQRCSYDDVLGTPLRQHARWVVLNSIENLLCIALQNQSKALGTEDLQIYPTLRESLQEPWIIDGGECEQSALVVPSEAGDSPGQLRKSTELPQVPILPARTNTIAICRSRGNTSIQGVIQAITHGQANLLTVAASLHGRIDVEWRDLLESVTPAPEYDPTPAWGDVSQTVPLARQGAD